MNLSGLSDWELVKRHAKLELEIQGELRERKILRTANNLIGDLAEHIFCTAYKWQPERSSRAGFDAISPARRKLKYQIKARRIIRDNANARQLSAIRNLEKGDFDFLAGLLFNKDYSVYKAALIPYKVVLKLVKDDKHVNGHRLLLRNEIWDAKWKAEGVKDVTDELMAVWH